MNQKFQECSKIVNETLRIVSNTGWDDSRIYKQVTKLANGSTHYKVGAYIPTMITWLKRQIEVNTSHTGKMLFSNYLRSVTLNYQRNPNNKYVIIEFSLSS